MKFRTTAIAMAVAGTVAAPVAVQAGADEIYASARVGVWNVDSGDVSDPEVRDFASRFGARGETDLGNGLTGFGRYEWGVSFNGGDSISSRHRYVGLKGDFGSVLVGRTYNTFYNFAVGPLDIPWWHSGYAMVAYVGRTDDALTYAGSSDNFAFGATAYMTRESEEDAVDVYELGASFTFGNDMTLGVAVQDTQADLDDGTGTLIGNGNDEPVVGVVLSGIMFGSVSLGFGAQVQDDDSSFLAHMDISNFYLHIEAEMLDEDSPANVGGDDEDRVSFTGGYTQSLGRKTTAYYEVNHVDNDTGDSDDDRTAIMAVLKYDII
ncbi:MAG: porin [Desulfobulbia bacterium]